MFLLVPLAVTGALTLHLRYLPVRHAMLRGLILARSRRWFVLALGLCAGFWFFSAASVIYETSLAFPLMSSFTLASVAWATWRAQTGMNPALRGMSLPLPQDGLRWVERSEPRSDFRSRLRVWLWRLTPLLPAWAALAWVAQTQMRRWPIWLALALAITAPALVVSYRRSWLNPLALLLVPAFFLWRAGDLRSRLPEGQWSTLWLAARCSDRVVPSGDGSAWCVNVNTERVYHFSLHSGNILEQYHVPDSWGILEAAPDGAWIRQDPIDNLVFASDNTTQSLGLYRPVYAAARGPDELWYVDWNQHLRLRTPTEPAGTTISHLDGLLQSRVLSVEIMDDGSVWVGARAGLNRLLPGSSDWERFGPEVGLRGSILRIVPAPDGTVWLLQPRGFGDSGDHWGVSALSPQGEWTHFDLEDLIGFEMPRAHDGMAVDAFGRLWLFLISSGQREKYLAVIQPEEPLLSMIASMGKLPASGAYRANSHGVITDGVGGIYLYNGELEPLRYWTP